MAANRQDRSALRRENPAALIGNHRAEGKPAGRKGNVFPGHCICERDLSFKRNDQAYAVAERNGLTAVFIFYRQVGPASAVAAEEGGTGACRIERGTRIAAGVEEAVAEAGQEVEVSTDDETDAGEVSDEDVGATTAESSQEHDEAAEEEAEAISEDTPEAIAESAGDDPAEESVDTELKQRIETLEQGVGAALDEVREALAIRRDTDPNAD